jgi:hypothetical protein
MDSNLHSLVRADIGRTTARRRQSIACAAILAAFALVPTACSALLSANEPIEVASSDDGGANADSGRATATATGDGTADGSPRTDAAAAFDGAGVVLSIAPNTVSFGGSFVSGAGSATPASGSIALIVNNEGVAPSPALDVSLVGNAEFSIDSTTCAAPLGPGESCTVDVSSAGTPGGPWVGLVQVGGEGVFAYAELFDEGTPALTLDSTCHDFGAVALGMVSPEFVYTLTNVTGAVVTGISVSFANYLSSAQPFYAGPTQTCGAVLEAGASCSIGVVFAPQSACAYAGISVTYGSSNSNAVYATLYGEDGSPDNPTPCYGACGVYGGASSCGGGPGTPCYDAGSPGGDGDAAPAASGSTSYTDAGAPPTPQCVPQTCAGFGYDCGNNGDGCGGVLNCGECVSPQVCGGGGYSKCG